jgi:hypothetical protein
MGRVIGIKDWEGYIFRLWDELIVMPVTLKHREDHGLAISCGGCEGAVWLAICQKSGGLVPKIRVTCGTALTGTIREVEEGMFDYRQVVEALKKATNNLTGLIVQV